jgi:hypothetical protein
VNGAGIPVNQTVIFSPLILSDFTKTPFPLGYTAMLGTKFTLDLSPLKGLKIRGELFLNKALFGHLCTQDLRKTENVSGEKDTEAPPANLQEFPFRQAGSM